MIPIKLVDIAFVIVHILYLTVNVRGGEEVMTLEFPYDSNSSNTSATAVFIAEEDIADLTLCFAFRVDAFKNSIRDDIQLLQLEGEEETLAEIVFTNEDQNSELGFSTRRGYSNAIHLPFALLTWVRACFSENNGSVNTVR